MATGGVWYMTTLIINALLKHVKGTHLETAICLAAFEPMRRGEIWALTQKDISHFRFHDLCHYGASILHAISTRSVYNWARCWSTDHVMTIYHGAINEVSKKMNCKINEHFESMQHDMQHKNKKPGKYQTFKSGADGGRTRVQKPIPCSSTIIVSLLTFPPPPGN